MMPLVSLSTTSRRRSAAAMSSSPSTKNDLLTACDVISVRYRRRCRSTRYSNKSNARGMTTSSCASPRPLMLLFVALASFFFANKVAPVHALSAAKNQWISKSLSYYNQVTRGAEHVKESPTYLKSAMENYFALEKIRDNKPHHAESIYRRLVDEMNPLRNNQVGPVETCVLSNLAVPTLLLGLLLQREERYEDARAVFDGFSHVLEQEELDHNCSCCARVLQANALFELKQDNPIKAADLIIRAVKMDRNLRPVLRWKLFRNAMIEYKAVHKARLQLQRHKPMML